MHSESSLARPLASSTGLRASVDKAASMLKYSTNALNSGHLRMLALRGARASEG
ncbi:hypothetical protein J108_17080 [Mycobacteroides abscessus subsp. bolletii CRM-0020]|uniref:Uncharacterized protein n=1 Tax=Mycobacteroides abscessus subsp. bolletii CRM-0020 TaxID=1306401 RepID=A0A829HRR0_9MYCO|nr:hypothetical protein MYCMA_05805 [Mycobacteroides abscessus subsp. massiliense str. GO 06]EHC00125.1 hypothetical protein MAB47J26_01400 [Mycobacteroides abscessus 47J26]EPQ22414.1 hypothetical protein J108_17080 [Mycobacteroides abscessus subsp. bolletii CRM-0020]